MIGKVVRGDDPHGLLRYLLPARKGLSDDHIDTRHIINRDLAGAEMAAVIAGAPNRSRIKRPIEHIIAWRRAECPAIAEQKRAAWSLVQKLGLLDNQIVVVVHDEAKSGLVPGPDGRHHEVHIAINRVRLDGTVAKLDHDYARVEVACAEIAAEMGFHKIPGRFNGGAAALARPGVGNAIRSIAAQRGITNIAEQLRQDAAAMAALRTARQQGWEALLAAFKAQGVVVAAGQTRPKPGLRRGLVLIDAGDAKRRIKISAMDDVAEKWSSGALEKQLGPMPPGWEKVFADDATRDENEARSTPLSPRSHADTSSSIADEIRSDPDRISRLRAARAAGWGALIQEFSVQGLTVERGHNARRGIETGLVMVDRARPGRREPLSRLDTPFEKWGAGALTRELGPWPEEGRKATGASLGAAKIGAEERRGPQRPAFDRDAAYRDYLTVKAEAVAHNRALHAEAEKRKAPLLATQRRDRDRHYALRRLRRELVRGAFGWRSLVGRAINAVADALFADRMRALARAQSGQRRTLVMEAAAQRVQVPTWASHLRAAQALHAESVRASERRAAEAAWLDRVRARRRRLKSSPVALARLAKALAAVDARLEGQFGLTVEYMLSGGHVSTAVMLDDLRQLDAGQTSAAAWRRVPVLIERTRERLWLEEVRARRERLHKSAGAKARLERRRSRSRPADDARAADESTDARAQISPPPVARDRADPPPSIARAGEPAAASVHLRATSAEATRREPSETPSAPATASDAAVLRRMRAHVLASATRPAEPDGRPSFHKLLTAAGPEPSSAGDVEGSPPAAGSAPGRNGPRLRAEQTSASASAEAEQQRVGPVEPLTRMAADVASGAFPSVPTASPHLAGDVAPEPSAHRTVPESSAPPTSIAAPSRATEQPRNRSGLDVPAMPSVEPPMSVDRTGMPGNGQGSAGPHGEGEGPRSDPAAEVRRRLVARYALVLAACNAWSDDRKRRLAALAPVDPGKLWGLALDECRACFGHGKPSTIARPEVSRLLDAVLREAETVGFVALPTLRTAFLDEKRRIRKGRGGRDDDDDPGEL